jgi:6-phosphogluconolactonase (cycloisomerase 2 family)
MWRTRQAFFVSIFFSFVCISSAQAQDVSLLPTSLTFSSQAVGTTSRAQVVTLTNTDAAHALTISSIVASGDFTQTNTCGSSVAAGGSCAIGVTFVPTATGAIDGSISISDNAPGSPQLLGLKGTGIALETVSASSLNFGTVAIGKTSAAKAIQLTNHATSAISITAITASGDFTAVPATTGGCSSTLAANASCTEDVSFTPTELGAVDGSLIFADAGTQQYVTLTGTGSGTADSPITLTPPSLTFGSQTVGTTSAEQGVIIENTGTTSLALTFAASGSFSKSNPASGACGSSLASGAICTIDVKFSPAVLGPIEGGISISYSGANSPQVVSLTGTGIVHVTTISPSSIAFLPQKVGTTSAAKIVTVTNNFTSAVTVSSIVPSTDFTETNTCDASIAAGKSCTISVSFAPTRGGSALGSVIITDSATNNPQIVDLSGSGFLVSRFAFVGNSAGTVATISTYTVNLNTGQLRNNGYVLAASSQGSFLEAEDPSERFAYALGSGGISAYTINASTGTLTLIAGSPYATGPNPISITVDPSGKFAYAVNFNSGGVGSVSAYTIDGGTGALTSVAGSPFAAGDGSASMAIDPTGRFAYVINKNDSPGGDVSGYTIDAATGALIAMPDSPFLSRSGAFAVAIAPNGKFGYIGSGSGAQVTPFSINQTTGIPTAVAGSPFSGAGGGSSVVVVSPSSEFVYTAGSSDGSVSAFSVNPTTGALTSLASSPFAGGDNPLYATVDPKGTLLYMTNSGSDEIWTYSFATNGALTLLNTARTQQAPGPVLLGGGSASVTYTPKFAYVADGLGNAVSAYTVNATSGALTQITGSPFSAGIGPVSVSVDPTGRFAYVANANDNDVSAYTINATTGALTALASSPFPAGVSPTSVTVDPSGQFAYVANQGEAEGQGGDDVSAYTINATTGAPTALASSPFPTGDLPLSVTVDPTGQFAYVANYNDGTVSAYTINASTGALTALSSSPFPAGSEHGPESVTVDPSGRFAYVAATNDNTVWGYAINAGTGALTQLTSSPFSAGSFPVSVTVDPSGQFAYVAGYTSGVSAYTINATTGALTQLTSSPFSAGSFPVSVTVDPSGQFAYVANSNSADVSAYTINATTGALTQITSSPFPAGNEPLSITTTGRIH